MSTIRRWLDEVGLSQYADAFEENDVSVDVLSEVSESDLEKLGVSLGHRKKLIRAIAALGESPAASASGERRHATVMFSDLSGYTAMNEALDPEDVEGFMSRIKSNAVEIVERHGGIVNQFVGDEVLALFGIAASNEDDPIRAVRAALDLHEMVREIAPEIEAQVGQAVRLHTGLNTGLVVTHLKDDRDGRYGVTGDAVNTAARLKALAEPDEILLSPETLKFTRTFFTSVPHGPVQLKGKSDPIVPHRVTGTTRVSSRFAAAEQRGLTPFTGRSDEIGLLASGTGALHEGRGRLVTISGPPGAGKSRLLFEFRRDLDRDQLLVLQGRCQSFGRDMSYSPFVEALLGALQLTDVESSELHETAIANTLAIDPELEQHVAYYLELLSIPSTQYRLPPFEGDEKRRAFEEALFRLLALASRARPIVLTLEDWHWADEASDSALSYLVDRIDELPVLVLVTHRPEYDERWSEAASHSSLVLAPLPPSDTEAMVAHSLGATVLPEGFLDLICSRTDGNPLFIEEVCRSLVEDGTLRIEDGVATLTRPAEELVLPDTVKAVIRARLDRLEASTQEPLHLAAVIGGVFDRRVLERVHGDASRVDEALAALVRQGVIQKTGARLEAEYAFKHVLIQVVAYETLLLRRRRELHALVGQAIEATHADRLPQHCEALAQHFDLGQVWPKAVAYRVQSGIKSAQHHVIGSALKHFERAREILAQHTPEVPWRVRYDLLLHRGNALGEMGQWRAAYREISEAQRLAEREEDVGLRVRAQASRATAAFWAHEFDAALDIIGDLEALLGQDPNTQLRLASMQALISFMNEHLPVALAKEEEAHALFLSAPNSPSRSLAAFVAGAFHRWRGDSQAASEALEIAVTLGKKESNAGGYLQSLMHYCLAIGELGRYQEAIDLLLEGREYGINADSLYGVLKINNTLGWAYGEVFDFDRAIEYNQMSIVSTDEVVGANTSTLSEVASFARLNLGDVHLATGQLDLAKEQFEAAAANLSNDDFLLARTRWKPRCLMGLGELSLMLGDVERAEALVAEVDAHGFTDGFPFKKHQLRAARLRAGIHAARGRADAAVEVLEDALGKARSLDNPTQLWKLELALGDRLAEAGQKERAGVSYLHARQVVESLANGLTDPELKTTFLRAPPIRNLISTAP